MNPSEFTLDFYLTCLSQAKWHSDDPVDVRGVNLMHQVAVVRRGAFGDAYIVEYNKHFPVATTATEPKNNTPKTNTTMNTLLKEIYDTLINPVVEVLTRIATALEASPGSTTTHVVQQDGSTVSATVEAEEPTTRKKRGPNKPKEEPAPEPEPPAKEEPYMSGDELADLMKPLAPTPYSAQLVDYRNNTLGWKLKTREMTDPDMLRKMEAKIREFLAANEADQSEP